MSKPGPSVSRSGPVLPRGVILARKATEAQSQLCSIENPVIMLIDKYPEEARQVIKSQKEVDRALFILIETPYVKAKTPLVGI